LGRWKGSRVKGNIKAEVSHESITVGGNDIGSEFDGCRDKIMVQILNAIMVPDMRSWSQGLQNGGMWERWGLRGARKGRYGVSMQGKRKDGMGNFRSGFCHSSLRLERSSSNTWIGEAEGRYGRDDMIA
jgi:hypothetical protein